MFDLLKLQSRSDFFSLNFPNTSNWNVFLIVMFDASKLAMPEIVKLGHLKLMFCPFLFWFPLLWNTERWKNLANDCLFGLPYSNKVWAMSKCWLKLSLTPIMSQFQTLFYGLIKLVPIMPDRLQNGWNRKKFVSSLELQNRWIAHKFAQLETFGQFWYARNKAELEKDVVLLPHTLI